MVELIGGGIAVALTLLVFSRLIGDNPAFRLVQYLFVGASLGYAFVVVYHQVLKPATVQLLSNVNDPWLVGLQLTPFVLGLLLLSRITARQTFSWLANIPLALLFGVGVALALGGAIAGTLLPQLLDTVRPAGPDPLRITGAVLLALGVILTLCYFYFTLPRTTILGRAVAGGAQVGRWLLIIAFGVFFAGALLTYLTALNGRLEFIVSWFRSLLV